MSRGQRKVCSLIACWVVAVLLTLVWPAEREPVYKGKKLGNWLVDDLWISSTRFLGNPAKEAVREIGTNALPFLERWIAYKPPAWRWPVVRTIEKGNRQVASWFNDRKALRADGAREAFYVLGDQASPAIPELARLAQGRDRFVGLRAVAALRGIGKATAPSLLCLLGNEQVDVMVRSAATNALLRIAPEVMQNSRAQ